MNDIGDLLGAAERTEICLANLPGFNLPKQVRTQKKTDLIVSAAAHLLQQKSFSNISVQDIAHLANCAVTAIYARFVDKDALLPAVHLIILEQNRVLMKSRIRPERYTDKCIEEFSSDFVEMIEIFYNKNHNFIEAAIRGNNKYVFSQTEDNVEEWASACNGIVSTLLRYDPADTLKSLKFAIHQMNAIYRDRVITGAHSGLTSQKALSALFSTVIREKLSA